MTEQTPKIWQGETQTILDCDVVMSSRLCPEQYEVFKDHKQIGYLRLRNGWFYASYPDCSEDIVFEHQFDDEYKGAFGSDSERHFYISSAVFELLKRHEKEEANNA